MKDYSNVIQNATTNINDTSKSAYREITSGGKYYYDVVPANGYWGSWNWDVSRIRVDATSVYNKGVEAGKSQAVPTIIESSFELVGVFVVTKTTTLTNVSVGDYLYVCGDQTTSFTGATVTSTSSNDVSSSPYPTTVNGYIAKVTSVPVTVYNTGGSSRTGVVMRKK